MNEQITQKLVEWMNSIQSFASDEIPSFVREVAFYGYVVHGMWLIFFFCINLIMLGFFVRQDKREDKQIAALADLIAVFNRYINVPRIFDGQPVNRSEYNRFGEFLHQCSKAGQNDFWVFRGIFFFVFIWCVFGAFYNGSLGLKALLAPKLYVIERFTK